MSNPPIRFRPHHVLCSLGFEGHGYSDRFTANMAAIVVERLRGPGGEDEVIEITGQADSICAPCPKRRGTGCAVEARIETLDRAHGTALGLAPGDRLTWGQAQARVAAQVSADDLDTLCKGCQWLSLGLCKSAVARLGEVR